MSDLRWQGLDMLRHGLRIAFMSAVALHAFAVHLGEVLSPEAVNEMVACRILWVVTVCKVCCCREARRLLFNLCPWTWQPALRSVWYVSISISRFTALFN